MPLYALHGDTPAVPDHHHCWIAPSAVVLGRVTLGEDASVWHQAVLRGDNAHIRIGARSNVQDGAVLHADDGYPLTVGADCTIGHRVILHGCTVEDGVIVGMGATVMNGAVIGAGSFVGANALVTENKHFPPGSVIVGAPAKAVRTLNAAASAALRESAAQYVANWKRAATGLVPVA